MSDLLLNADGDIDITNGSVTLINSTHILTGQRLSIKFNTLRGEWYLDLSVGVPYFQEILKRGDATKNIADTVFKNIITEDPNVIKLISFQSSIINQERYVVYFKATVETGEIVTIEQTINI